MINIAEILEFAPKGLKLYSRIHGEVVLADVLICADYPISLSTFDSNGEYDDEELYDKYGKFYKNCGEPNLFPSKDHQTWDNWQKVLIPQCVGSVTKGDSNCSHCSYLWIVTKTGMFAVNMYEANDNWFHSFEKMTFEGMAFASPKETEAFFERLDKLGYKFEDGEVVVKDLKNMGCESWCKYDAKDGDFIRTYDLDTIIFSRISNGGAECYMSYNKKEDRLSIPKRGTFYFNIDEIYRPATQEEKDELLKKLDEEGYVWNQEELRLEMKENNKNFSINDFKSFDKVLVRDGSKQYWIINLFSHYDETSDYPYKCLTCSFGFARCVPYNAETAHLLGTTENYDGPYKTWED